MVFFASFENGWSCESLGLNWLQRILDRSTKEKAGWGHRLLVVDSHSSHINLKFIDYADQNRILIAVLPPHSCVSVLLSQIHDEITCNGMLIYMREDPTFLKDNDVVGGKVTEMNASNILHQTNRPIILLEISCCWVRLCFCAPILLHHWGLNTGSVASHTICVGSRGRDWVW